VIPVGLLFDLGLINRFSQIKQVTPEITYFFIPHANVPDRYRYLGITIPLRWNYFSTVLAVVLELLRSTVSGGCEARVKGARGEKRHYYCACTIYCIF